MLSELLQLLAQGQSLSLSQLAQRSGYPVRQVEGALEQLHDMGYILREELGQGCSSSGCSTCSGSCDACSLAPANPMTAWILTDKGHSFITRGKH